MNGMLARVLNTRQTDWDDHLIFVLPAYRSSGQSVSGFSLNCFIVGKENGMALDLVCGRPKEVVNEGHT